MISSGDEIEDEEVNTYHQPIKEEDEDSYFEQSRVTHQSPISHEVEAKELSEIKCQEGYLKSKFADLEEPIFAELPDQKPNFQNGQNLVTHSTEYPPRKGSNWKPKYIIRTLEPDKSGSGEQIFKEIVIDAEKNVIKAEKEVKDIEILQQLKKKEKRKRYRKAKKNREFEQLITPKTTAEYDIEVLSKELESTTHLEIDFMEYQNEINFLTSKFSASVRDDSNTLFL